VNDSLIEGKHIGDASQKLGETSNNSGKEKPDDKGKGLGVLGKKTLG